MQGGEGRKSGILQPGPVMQRVMCGLKRQALANPVISEFHIAVPSWPWKETWRADDIFHLAHPRPRMELRPSHTSAAVHHETVAANRGRPENHSHACAFTFVRYRCLSEELLGASPAQMELLTTPMTDLLQGPCYTPGLFCTSGGLRQVLWECIFRLFVQFGIPST